MEEGFDSIVDLLAQPADLALGDAPDAIPTNVVKRAVRDDVAVRYHRQWLTLCDDFSGI
jgi:F420-0:gamma-glutamyl ligase